MDATKGCPGNLLLIHEIDLAAVAAGLATALIAG